MKLNINKQYLFKGSRDEFVQILDPILEKNGIRNNSYTSSEVINDSFRLISKHSSGTAIGKGGPLTKGISIFCTISDLAEKELKINIKTKLRIEIYATIILALFFYAVMIFGHEKIPFWVFAVPIIPIPWFQFIYRIQEKSLMKIFIKDFKLIEI